MEGKITTNEEYQNSMKDKKEIRDEIFNLKIELFMNQNSNKKLKLLEEKQKVLKSKNAKLAYKIKEYEKILEEKKEGIKK